MGQGSQIRLGDLLTQAGLVKAKDLREAMIIAKQQSLPVGRVLIMAQFISEPNLQAAVQAQSMLKDEVLDLKLALDGLSLTSQKGISLDEALAELGWQNKSDTLTNKLGELLIEAGLVPQEKLESGLAHTQESGLPLGRVLVTTGSITEEILASTLNAQILIRDGKISREQAIQGLKACRDRQITIEESLSEVGLKLPTQESVRLGELLVMAGMLDENVLMNAVELGLVEEKPIGQVLIETAAINSGELDAALAVQKAVAEGQARKTECGAILKSVATQGLALDEAIKQSEAKQSGTDGGSRKLPLYQFLQLSGIINAKDIEEALKLGSKDTELMGRMLLLANAIDEHLLDCAVYLNHLMGEESLNAEQAMLAMGLCQSRNCSVEEAFKSLGWETNFDEPERDTSQDTIPPTQVFATPLTTMEQGGLTQEAGVGETTGQHQQLVTGDHQAVQAGLETGGFPALDPASQTSDVPTVKMELNEGGTASTNPTEAQAASTASESKPASETTDTEPSDDDDDPKGKSRKRLADLMP